MRRRLILLCLLSGASSLGGPALAEAELDGSTGSTGSFAGDFEIPAAVGRQAGSNLFHSFDVFHVRTGESATFTGPAGITNVISRVTGGAVSEIDGLLASTVPGADVFFLNPAGVLFGPNASLNLPGSFHVSTADELRFQDGAAFSATDPATSTFTMAPPESFGFLGAGGPIVVDRGRLETTGALSLVGGQISMTGANQGLAGGGSSGLVRVPGGLVALAALAGAGEVAISGATASSARGDIRLIDQAAIDVSGDGGGTVRIRAGAILLTNDSLVLADNFGSNDARSGINVEATTVMLRSGAELAADAFSTGAGGWLRVRGADELLVADGASIASSAFAGGDAGPIEIASGRVIIAGEGSGAATGIITDAVAGTGDAGPIEIVAKDVTVEAGGRISSGTFSAGEAGRILVDADTLLISGDRSAAFFTGIASAAEIGSTGNSGSIAVSADEVNLRDGGAISSRTSSAGAGGKVTIEAVRLDADAAGVEAVSTASGVSGQIELQVNELHLRNQGFVSTVALGQGFSNDVDAASGSIDIAASGEIVVVGRQVDRPSVISTLTVGAQPAGPITIATPLLRMPRFATINSSSGSLTASAGGIEVVADRLVMGPAALIDSSSLAGTFLGRPDATAAPGSISIQARDSVELVGDPTGEVAAIGTVTTTAGTGGSIRIATGNLRLADATITAGSTGSGNAGTIFVVAEQLQMDDAAIATNSVISGGGQIAIDVGELINLRSSEIITSVAGDFTTTAGDIAIDPEFVVLNGSRIVANAREGAGGNIRIVAGNFFATPDSVVDASSELGIDGTVEVTAPDLDLTGELAVLPTAYVDVSGLLRESCAARASDQTSSFASTGGERLAPDPAAPLAGRYAGPRSVAAPAAFHHWSLHGGGGCDD